MIDRAEIMLHEFYGQKEYWIARRSMRYASHLIKKADEIRSKLFNELNTSENQDSKGGDYLGVHLRRGDFLHVRKSNLISIENISYQLRYLLIKLNLKQLYLATDATVKGK